jgi:hypothetical protein
MPKAVDYDPFADEAPAFTRGKPVDFDPFADEQPYDLGKDLKRQLGLTARAGVTGVMGIPNLIGDAANSAINLGTSGINKVLGTKIPALDMPSDVTQRGMTAAGIPEPQGLLEKLVGVGGSALSGAGGARALSQIPQIPQAVRGAFGTLADAPKLQAVGAVSGALGVEGAREAGVENPLALMAVGSIAGMAPGGSATTLSRLGSGARQAAAPFTNRGREVLVGEALNRVANTPSATAARMETPEVLVPGSRPMVHEVSRDPGMIGAYSALRGMDPEGRIPQRLSQQNSARQAEMGRISGTEGTLQRATEKRDSTYAQMAQPAFDNASPVRIGREWINNPVVRTIREIRESPAGARQTVREALDEAEGLITQDGADLSDARVLYEIRKDLDLLRTGQLSGAGKSGRERANMRTAERELSRVISSLDQTIESGAPGYQSYMRMFAKRSVPLEQLKGLQSLREKAVLAAPDPLTGEDVLSQAKFRTLLRNNTAPNPNYQNAPLNGRGPGQTQMRISVPGTREPVLANLSSQQIRTLDRIAQDLDRGAAATAGTMKVPGSDTFKNLSVAAVMGRVLGDKTGELAMQSSGGKAIAAPLSFLYRMPDRDVQMLMLEAWLDPALASRLMRQATRAEIEGVATELGRRAAQQSAASAIYGAE